MPIEFLEIANTELSDAQRYYNKQQSNLGNIFKQEVYSSLLRIQEFPKAYAKTEGNIRKYLLHKFKYSIFYSIEKTNILIIAIAHQHRKPNYWIDRV
jgi:mRNA-degrading endonuclease RelE of RelBE toxin-antitoxin system